MGAKDKKPLATWPAALFIEAPCSKLQGIFDIFVTVARLQRHIKRSGLIVQDDQHVCGSYPAIESCVYCIVDMNLFSDNSART
jgi:molybdopterin-guanine dinucleotide biosynthesis protein A